MTKRYELMNLLSVSSDEKILDLITFLRDGYNISLEDVESAAWRVRFFTKALESYETGEKVTFEHPLTGKPFIFDPDGEDKEQIARMLVESKHDLIKGRKLVSLLSTFKDIFDNEVT